MKWRVDVLHGVNLDQLGSRPSEFYGELVLSELEHQVRKWAHELDIAPAFSQTNHEGDYCELLHRARDTSDGLLLNPGAWTHYSWAIRDALEVAAMPAVEVHLSAVSEREEFRRASVIRDLCIGTVEGRGLEGYRTALELLRAAIEERAAK